MTPRLGLIQTHDIDFDTATTLCFLLVQTHDTFVFSLVLILALIRTHDADTRCRLWYRPMIQPLIQTYDTAATLCFLHDIAA